MIQFSKSIPSASALAHPSVVYQESDMFILAL